MFPERMKRVQQQVARELAIILDREIKDPRVGMVTVSHVGVSRDLRKADVYVSRLGEDSTEDKECLEGLEKASGYIRRLLAQRVEFKNIPALNFHLDTAPSKAIEMEKLFKQINDERDSKSQSDPPSDFQSDSHG